MGEQNEPGALGTQIGDARRAKGMTQQQLADAVGVDRKTVNRWENGRTQGLGANFAKLADALGWSPRLVPEMLRGNTVFLTEELEVALHSPPFLHPIAAEVNELLGNGSPLTGAERGAFEELLTRVVRTVGQQHIVVKRGDAGVDVVVHNADGRVEVMQVKRSQPSITLQNLGSLLEPDSPISDAARQALQQLVASALRLGEEAMLLHDARYGMSDEEVLQRVADTHTRGEPLIPQPKGLRRVSQER